MNEAYTVFTHLLGEGDVVLAGHDGQPDGGHYSTTAWQPGQVILDDHWLTVPKNSPPGEYQLEAGFYLLSTMDRLPAFDDVGRRLPGDAALLGAVVVGE
jgi:hypothetical protein